jgi:hypothetical protein
MPVGTALSRTEAAEGSRVGIPDMRDSSEDIEARAADSEGELKESVGALPGSVVAAACGIGSPSEKAARLTRTIGVRNILSAPYWSGDKLMKFGDGKEMKADQMVI